MGLFDTDVLSVKARQAGYSLAACRDLFVHHFGTRTFAHGAPGPGGDTASAMTSEHAVLRAVQQI